MSRKWKCLATWKLTEQYSLVGLIDYFRILKVLIILFLLFVYMNYVPKWESSGRNASRFQFRCCENTTETSKLFQNDPPSFASSSKISPHSFVTLSRTVESFMNGCEGLGVTFKLVGCNFRTLRLVY